MKKLTVILFLSIIYSTDWGIDTTYSYIKYKGEHTFHSWQGISKNIDFNLECNDENICTLEVSTSLENFDSGNDSRDSNMLYYTESLLYPIVTFYSEEFIPKLGTFIVGDKKPYEYLIKSIKQFPSQKKVSNLLKKNGFKKVTFTNMLFGIVTIYECNK